VAQLVKNLHAMQETQAQSPGGDDPLEKEMAVHSSIWTGQRSLMAYSPWCCQELDRTQQLNHLMVTCTEKMGGESK